jgi:Ras-related protein Rab-21
LYHRRERCGKDKFEYEVSHICFLFFTLLIISFVRRFLPLLSPSSESNRYCQGEFSDHSTPTIGASFLQHRVTVDGVDISLQIWDTAGQERFRSMAPMYYRGAKAAVLVFDITNEETFYKAKSWLKDLKGHADPDVVICLAGNKCDKEAVFDLKQCEEFAKSVDAVFVKTSAQSGEGVNKLFSELTKRIVDVYKTKSMSGADGRGRGEDALVLDGNSNRPAGGGGCC